MKLISPIIAAIIITFAGAGLTAAPVQQVTPVFDGGHQHMGYETQIAALSTEVYIERQINRDQSTLNAAMWGTLDTMSISTQVATLVGTSLPASMTPTPTRTPTATLTPSATTTPTATNTPQGTAPTPTSEVPTEPTIEDISTPSEGDLVQFYGNATSQNVNIRACAGANASCPVVGTLPEHGTLGLCAGSAVVVGSYEFWQIATEIGAPHQWIAVRNVDNGALLMASLNHEQVSVDTDCG